MTGAGLIRSDALALPLRDESVDLIVTSPPYFALRSYTDGGEHYDGQIGSEPTPADFLVALWTVLDECWRVLKPSGSCWVNLGDSYAGTGKPGGGGEVDPSRKSSASGKTIGAKDATGTNVNQRRSGRVPGIRAKSLMGLPWRWALGATCPDPYRTCYQPGGHPQWVLRAEVVWSKPNGLPESVTDRVRRSHEQWFHLTKQGRYFAAVDEVREDYAPGTAERYASGYNPSAVVMAGQTKNGPLRVDGGGPSSTNPLGKLPGSVWTIPSEPLRVPEHLGVDHFAAYPQEWPRRIILGWSPSGICTVCGEGRRPVVDRKPMEWRESPTIAGRTAPGATRKPMSGTMLAPDEATITGYACACWSPDDLMTAPPTRPAVVLDPFGGTGTTAMVARALGRYGVHVDLSADYLRLARWRIFESGHAAKAAAKTNAERQLDLFGGAA